MRTCQGSHPLLTFQHSAQLTGCHDGDSDPHTHTRAHTHVHNLHEGPYDLHASREIGGLMDLMTTSIQIDPYIFECIHVAARFTGSMCQWGNKGLIDFMGNYF